MVAIVKKILRKNNDCRSEPGPQPGRSF